MQEKLMQFEKMLERELEMELDKINQSDTISAESIKTLKDAFKLKKLVKECCDEEGYSSRRGRSRRTGRYVSRGSYDGSSNSFGSYDGSNDGGSSRYSNRNSSRDSYGYSGHGKMIQHLERMYDEAEDEKERQMIEEWIRKAEQ